MNSGSVGLYWPSMANKVVGRKVDDIFRADGTIIVDDRRIGVSVLRRMTAPELRKVRTVQCVQDHGEPVAVLIPYAIFAVIQTVLSAAERAAGAA